VVLGSKWWDATRKAAYASTAYHCAACGVWKMQALGRRWLEGHERYELDYARGRATYVETVPLCHFCHNYIHDGRLLALLQRGEVHQAKYVAIMQHGDSVLFRAGLRKQTRAERDEEFRLAATRGEVAAWKDWRLVVDGVEYPPLYKSLEEWQQAMHPDHA
jgi:hypothetical protein